LLPFAALHWWRGPPARSGDLWPPYRTTQRNVGVDADAAGEDARATNSN
jgi:hypothetical protein